MYSGDLNPSHRHGRTYQAALTKPVQTTADRIALCRAMNKGK